MASTPSPRHGRYACEGWLPSITLNAIPWAIAGDRFFPVAGRPYQTMSGPFLVSLAYGDSSGGTSLRLLPMPLSVDGWRLTVCLRPKEMLRLVILDYPLRRHDGFSWRGSVRGLIRVGVGMCFPFGCWSLRLRYAWCLRKGYGPRKDVT